MFIRIVRFLFNTRCCGAESIAAAVALAFSQAALAIEKHIGSIETYCTLPFIFISECLSHLKRGR